MSVTSFSYYSGPSKPRPKVGDRKVIRGILCERRMKKVYDLKGRPLGYDCTGGRQRYEWVPVDPAPTAPGMGGFTLIELMVTVVIIGVLAAIAYPSYLEHVARARRAAATAVLSDAAMAMERYQATNDTYAGAPVPSAVAPKGATGTGVYYTIAFSGVPDADGYTLQATPVNAQAADGCGVLGINQAGAQTAAKAGCW